MENQIKIHNILFNKNKVYQIAKNQNNFLNKKFLIIIILTLPIKILFNNLIIIQNILLFNQI